jgi:hypothetical protein
MELQGLTFDGATQTSVWSHQLAFAFCDAIGEVLASRVASVRLALVRSWTVINFSRDFSEQPRLVSYGIRSITD